MTTRRFNVSSRRGLTLIEILIVVAILIAIGAIIAPAALNQIEQRTFEAAIDRMSGHLLLARSHAQQSGHAVEVIYRHDPPMLIARYFDVNATADNNRGPSSQYNSELSTQGTARGKPELARSWARRTLPDPVILTLERPEFLDPEPMEDDREGGFGGQAGAAADFTDELPDFMNRDGDSAGDQPIRLSVFLPDGTVVLARDVWISDQRERAASLRINAWTGDTIVRRPSRTERNALADPAAQGRRMHR